MTDGKYEQQKNLYHHDNNTRDSPSGRMMRNIQQLGIAKTRTIKDECWWAKAENMADK
jgi:hypothetical protein